MADILGIQILGILFGVFMLYFTFLQRKRRVFTTKEYSFWMILWTVFLIVTIFPALLDPVVKSLSLARIMDFFIILGFMFLVGSIFYTYTIVRGNQKKLEEIVRKIAMKKQENKKKII